MAACASSTSRTRAADAPDYAASSRTPCATARATRPSRLSRLTRLDRPHPPPRDASHRLGRQRTDACGASTSRTRAADAPDCAPSSRTPYATARSTRPSRLARLCRLPSPPSSARSVPSFGSPEIQRASLYNSPATSCTATCAGPKDWTRGVRRRETLLRASRRHFGRLLEIRRGRVLACTGSPPRHAG